MRTHKFRFSCGPKAMTSKNAGYELLQRYTTNEFVVRMPAEYPGARDRIAKVTCIHEYVNGSANRQSLASTVTESPRPRMTTKPESNPSSPLAQTIECNQPHSQAPEPTVTPPIATQSSSPTTKYNQRQHLLKQKLHLIQRQRFKKQSKLCTTTN